MIYVKSFLAGVGALIAYYFLFVTVGVRLLVHRPPDLPEGVGYISGSPWARLWTILLVALLVFTVACFWTFRKLKANRTQR
ncbi:MAG: hypothetical protein ABSG41_09920 [Bryobacteraceae bacterium]|jgi:ABC-type antimicrobial peptide transport system permease subunit